MIHFLDLVQQLPLVAWPPSIIQSDSRMQVGNDVLAVDVALLLWDSNGHFPTIIFFSCHRSDPSACAFSTRWKCSWVVKQDCGASCCCPAHFGISESRVEWGQAIPIWSR